MNVAIQCRVCPRSYRRQSRSLFIRTMTVGPGITPGLLTFRVVGQSLNPEALAG